MNELKQIFGADALSNMNHRLYISFSAKKVRFGITPKPKEVTRGGSATTSNPFSAAVTVIDGNEGCVMLTDDTQYFEWFSVEKRPTSSITEGNVDMARCFYIDRENELTGAEIIPGGAERITKLMKYSPRALNPVLVCHANDGSVVEILIASNEELPGILVRAFIPQLGKIAVAAVDLPAEAYMSDDLPTFNDPRTMLIPWAQGQLQLINVRTKLTDSSGSSPLFPDELTKLRNGGVELTYYVEDELNMSTYFASVDTTLPVHMFYYGLDEHSNEVNFNHEGCFENWGFYGQDTRRVAQSRLDFGERADVWMYGTTSSRNDAKVIVQLVNARVRPAHYTPDKIQTLRIELRDQIGEKLKFSRRVDDITRVYKVYRSRVRQVYCDFTLRPDSHEKLCFYTTSIERPDDWRQTAHDVENPFSAGTITKCITTEQFHKGAVFGIAKAAAPAELIVKIIVEFA